MKAGIRKTEEEYEFQNCSASGDSSGFDSITNDTCQESVSLPGAVANVIFATTSYRST
jgi:hypothetical protein